MKKLILPIIMLAVLIACNSPQKELTAEEYDAEKTAIIKVMKEYNKASEEKNFAKIVETLASEVIFFGSDSAEVIKDFAQYKLKMLDQWNMFDKMKYGEMIDIDIQMDNQATVASIIFGIPFDVTIGDETAKLFLRIARSMKKEKGKWVIKSGTVGVVNPKEALIMSKLLEKKAIKQ